MLYFTVKKAATKKAAPNEFGAAFLVVFVVAYAFLLSLKAPYIANKNRPTNKIIASSIVAPPKLPTVII